MTNIAEAPAPTTIVFGTDGWRAKIADDYTFENVRRCADGVARYVVDRGEQAKGVVAESTGVEIDAAFTLLRAHARGNNLSLRAVAEGVVGRRLDPRSLSSGTSRRERHARRP